MFHLINYLFTSSRIALIMQFLQGLRRINHTCTAVMLWVLHWAPCGPSRGMGVSSVPELINYLNMVWGYARGRS